MISNWTKAMLGMAAVFCAVSSAMAVDNVSDANVDDAEIAATKAAIAEIQQELAAMKSTVDHSERGNLRSAATGGSPDALTNANGAKIRIGGTVITRYGIGWSSDYRTNADNTGIQDNRNYTSTGAGWAIPKAQLYFDIDLSRDTQGFLAFRFEGESNAGKGGLVEYAYWKWNNVGGQNYSVTIGLADVPFGMWGNTDIGGYNYTALETPMIVSPLITNDYHAGAYAANLFGRDYSTTGYGDANFGVYTSYTWGDDELVLRAGVMASKIQSFTTSAINSPGFNAKNEYRSLGFTDHVVALAYNPSWLEGLHLELSYMGRLDGGKGLVAEEGFNYADMNGNDIIPTHDKTLAEIKKLANSKHSYTPEIALGGSYKINDVLKVYAEGLLQWSPNYISGTAYGAIIGADYKINEKLLVGVSGEWTGYSLDVDRESPQIMPIDSFNWYRLNAGARYLFNSGIYVKAQYYHDFYHSVGLGDGHWKGGDSVVFETGYEF